MCLFLPVRVSFFLQCLVVLVPWYDSCLLLLQILSVAVIFPSNALSFRCCCCCTRWTRCQPSSPNSSARPHHCSRWRHRVMSPLNQIQDDTRCVSAGDVVVVMLLFFSWSLPSSCFVTSGGSVVDLLLFRFLLLLFCVLMGFGS